MKDGTIAGKRKRGGTNDWIRSTGCCTKVKEAICCMNISKEKGKSP